MECFSYFCNGNVPYQNLNTFSPRCVSWKPGWMATSLKKMQVANESQAIVDDSRWNSIKLVVNVLLSALAKYDPRFTFESVDSKVSKSFLTEKDTNHFELLIFLSSLSMRPEEISIHQNEVSQGYHRDINPHEGKQNLEKSLPSEREVWKRILVFGNVSF